MAHLTLGEARALYSQGGRARNIALKHYSDFELVNRYYSFDERHMLTPLFTHDGYNNEKPLAIIQGIANDGADIGRFLIVNPDFEMVFREFGEFKAIGFVKK